MKHIIFTFVLSLCQSVFAGGWVLGGGHQIGNSLNPWFLYSSDPVKYCVKIDESSISQKSAKIKNLIQQGIEYWRQDFIKIEKFDNRKSPFGGGLRSATQEFVEVDCETKPELQFLIGRGALSSEEVQFLSSYSLIAGSVRTDYNAEKLSGRGFIYLASDKGPFSFTQSDQVEQAWSYEGLMLRVIIHELGHVFGLQHTDRGVMMAQYPDSILKKKVYFSFTQEKNPESTLLPKVIQLGNQNPEVVQVRNDIQVVRATKKLFEDETVFLPSQVTLEWSLNQRTAEGSVEPLLIRASPFDYETYSLKDSKIRNVQREQLQCRPDRCVHD